MTKPYQNKTVGECLTNEAGYPWCYVDPHSGCDDETSSTHSDYKWSFQACRIKLGPFSCQCNGKTIYDVERKTQNGECLTMKNGKAWCYVNPHSGCNDEMDSGHDIYKMSFLACNIQDNVPSNVHAAHAAVVDGNINSNSE